MPAKLHKPLILDLSSSYEQSDIRIILKNDEKLILSSSGSNPTNLKCLNLSLAFENVGTGLLTGLPGISGKRYLARLPAGLLDGSNLCDPPGFRSLTADKYRVSFGASLNVITGSVSASFLIQDIVQIEFKI